MGRATPVDGGGPEPPCSLSSNDGTDRKVTALSVERILPKVDEAGIGPCPPPIASSRSQRALELHDRARAHTACQHEDRQDQKRTVRVFVFSARPPVWT